MLGILNVGLTFYSFPYFITSLRHRKLCLCKIFLPICLVHILLWQIASDESDFEVDDKPHDERVVTLKMVKDLENKIHNSR